MAKFSYRRAPAQWESPEQYVSNASRPLRSSAMNTLGAKAGELARVSCAPEAQHLSGVCLRSAADLLHFANSSAGAERSPGMSGAAGIGLYYN